MGENVKIYLQKVGWGEMDWIPLAEDRVGEGALVNAVINLRVPKHVWNLLIS